jgi:hypothetical protein
MKMNIKFNIPKKKILINNSSNSGAQPHSMYSQLLAGNFKSKIGTRYYSTSEIKDSSISLNETKDALKKAISEYSPVTSSSSERFKQVANGVFQSEGTISARFRGNSFTLELHKDIRSALNSTFVFFL